MIARFIVFLVLLLATITGTVALEGGSPLSLVGISAFILELFVPLFAMLAVWRWKQIGMALRHAFGMSGEPAERERSLRVWDFAEKACYAAAVLAEMLGFVIIANASGGIQWDLLHALGASFIGPIYGVFFGIVCRILRARVQG
jgi:hypothetical protein